MAQVRTTQVGGQIQVGEVGVRIIESRKICISEIGMAEIGVGKRNAVKACIGEVLADEVRAWNSCRLV